ncbi:hypothetical protein [Paenibacillus hamazuiensis]|uniref:hypothetical protein n=1 Tax=Paenibacillus hamazuiensis TaxID=2936508 RepID=UPI00200D64CF|nr:hypothetical protein [Paenibacillus hamazuiensis]
MAVDAIELQPAHYWGTAEINDSLQSLLNGKSPEVSKAVYTLIQSNLLPDGSVSDEEERAALLESGLSQAKFLADRYMTGEDSSKFLGVIRQIAAIAKTRTVDPETGQATYVTPPQKPIGAPDDYINTGELMKRFEPETYKRLQDAVTNGGDWGKILIEFAKKVPQNKDWVSTYREETDKLIKDMRNTKIENRFADVDTSSMEVFLRDMNSQFQKTSFASTDFLTRNLQIFARTLGH